MRKAHQCTLTNAYQVFRNESVHLRGCGPCGIIRSAKLTDNMKTFVIQQDESGIPSRVIVVNMRRQPSIPVQKHGWTTPVQVTNALKTLRLRSGAKNSLSAVRSFVAANAYTPTSVLTKPSFLVPHRMKKAIPTWDAETTMIISLLV